MKLNWMFTKGSASSLSFKYSLQMSLIYVGSVSAVIVRL